MGKSKRAISSSTAIILFVVIVLAAGIGFYELTSRSTTSSTSQQTSSNQLSSLTSASTTLSFTSASSSVSTFSSSVVSSTSSSVAETSSQTNATIAVLEDLGTQLGYLNNHNVEALANFYSSSSVVNWTGQAGGLGGIYTGTSNILILYIGSFSHVTNLVVHSSNLSSTAYGQNNVSVNFDLLLQGFSTTLGNLSARIMVSQIWQNQFGTWIIQHETWNYLSFTTTNPVTSTVFPQWGLALQGRNPDLASEHLLEWYAAPYVAAGIYGGILVIFLTAMYRRKRNSQS